MFKRAFLLECEKSDIDISFENIKSYPSILKKVEKFWAYPSYDTRCPPPHSTGGALDVCLSDKDCLLYTSPSPRDSDQSRMPSSA